MGLKDVFKGHSEQQSNRRRQRSETKPQYNKNIARSVTARVKALVPFYGLSENIIAEQCLEIGTYYMIKVTQDPEKLQEMKTHLIKDRYSDTVMPHDDEATLRMGEENDTWRYLEGIKDIMVRNSRFRRTVKPGGEPFGFDCDFRSLSNLLRTVERFCKWVHHHQSGG